MRNGNHRKSAVAGVISMLVLLGMFPVASSVSCDKLSKSVSEEAKGVVCYNTMMYPIPFITRPEEGGWYFFDVQVLSGMPTTRIVGDITMKVKVVDPTGSGVDRVEFYIDDIIDPIAVVYDYTIVEGAYWFEWVCGDELPNGEHEIVVWAWDSLDNYQSSLPITVVKGLFGLSVVEYSACLEVSETLQAAGVQVVSKVSGGVTYYSLNVNEMGYKAGNC